jgi:hypothetical protein
MASYYIHQSEFDKGARIGREILHLAERQQDTGMLVDGHLVVGLCLSTVEGIPFALEHLDQAIALVRAGASKSRPFRLGNNAGATCFTTSAFLLWMLGYPDKAVARAEEAMTLAAQLQHPYTLAYVGFHCGVLRLWLRQPELVRKHAVEVLHVAQQYDFPLWRALGTCLLGIADAELGRAEEGLAEVIEGIALYQEMKTPPVFWPYLEAMNAGAHGIAGEVAEGLVLIDDALDLASSGDTSPIAEFSPVKGELSRRGRGRCRRGALVPAGVRRCRKRRRQDDAAAGRLRPAASGGARQGRRRPVATQCTTPSPRASRPQT